MKLSIITIFPDVIRSYLGESLMGRAEQKGLVDFDVLNLRDYTHDVHRTVDDTPYGGGPGMVMKPEPFEGAMRTINSYGDNTRVIAVSPQGRPFTQKLAEELSGEQKRLVFLCGRYEGIDERVIDEYVDDEISLGDYVLTGGELPALVIIDAIVRLLPGVVGDKSSLVDESFSWGILDYPHYTRPPIWKDRQVPGELMSGNHAGIDRFRRKEALRRTLSRRPELLENSELSDQDNILIDEIKEE